MLHDCIIREKIVSYICRGSTPINLNDFIFFLLTISFSSTEWLGIKNKNKGVGQHIIRLVARHIGATLLGLLKGPNSILAPFPTTIQRYQVIHKVTALCVCQSPQQADNLSYCTKCLCIIPSHFQNNNWELNDCKCLVCGKTATCTNTPPLGWLCISPLLLLHNNTISRINFINHGQKSQRDDSTISTPTTTQTTQLLLTTTATQNSLANATHPTKLLVTNLQLLHESSIQPALSQTPDTVKSYLSMPLQNNRQSLIPIGMHYSHKSKPMAP
jgi:hypothetical protein